jgi:phospholipid-translocating ATPase
VSSICSFPEQARALGEFWRALAICHTVLTERPDEEDLNVLE